MHPMPTIIPPSFALLLDINDVKAARQAATNLTEMITNEANKHSATSLHNLAVSRLKKIQGIIELLVMTEKSPGASSTILPSEMEEAKSDAQSLNRIIASSTNFPTSLTAPKKNLVVSLLANIDSILALLDPPIKQ